MKNVTFQIIGIGSLVFMIVFGLFVKSEVPDLWFHIKTLNSFVAATVLSVYSVFQYPIGMVFIIF